MTHHLDCEPDDSVDLGGQGGLLDVRSEQKARLGVTLDEAHDLEELSQILRREDEIDLAAPFTRTSTGRIQGAAHARQRYEKSKESGA